MVKSNWKACLIKLPLPPSEGRLLEYVVCIRPAAAVSQREKGITNRQRRLHDAAGSFGERHKGGFETDFFFTEVAELVSGGDQFAGDLAVVAGIGF